jgi:peptide/nickel transport system substrate-binding protein
LRSDVKFSDGTPFDASAMKVNWDRFASATSTCACRSDLTGVTWVVTNPTTFTVTLPTSVGGFPAILANSNIGEIASPAALQKLGAGYGKSPDTTVGAGPWTLKEWVRGDHMTLVKNPSYWDAPRPYLSTFILKAVADLAQKAAAFHAGQADLALFPAPGPDTKGLSDAGFKAYGVLQPGGLSVQFVQQAPLNDLRVRKALVMAANLNDMNQKASNGVAQPVSTYFTKGDPFYTATAKQYPYNLKQAQQLIDEYVAEHGGQPVAFSLLYSPSVKLWGDAVLQSWAQLKNVNVTPDFQSATQSPVLTSTGRYQAALTSTVSPAYYPETFYRVLHAGLSSNVQKWSDPKLDAILDAGRTAVSVDARKKSIDNITKYITDNAMYLMLFHNQVQTYVQKNVKGVVMKDSSSIQPVGMWLAKK